MVRARRANLLAAASLAVALVLVAAAAVLFGAVNDSLDVFTAAMTLWVVVGALIIALQPRNPVGWLFALAGALWVTGLSATAATDAFDGWALTAVSWYGEWFWIAGFVLIVCSIFLMPTGRAASPAWRWTMSAFAVVGAAAVVLAAVQDTLHVWGELDAAREAPTVDNPIGIAGVGDIAERFVPALVLAGLVAATFSMVTRYRRGGADERERLKLVVLSAAVSVAAGVVAGAFDGTPLASVCWLVAFGAIPAGCAFAILRHQLFDVDRVISRTLVYVTLSIVLGAAYVGLVLAGQALFASFAGGSNLAIAVSTLVVAALFLPVRSRIQQLVDRRFYRRRYDAQRTLERFGVRLREQIDLSTLEHDLRGVVTETMQPVHAAVWLRETAR
jgi:hypothetical protein